MTGSHNELDTWLSALERASGNPRRSGNGWSAKCPAHDDRTPSLSIAEQSGKVLVKCHKGCSFEAVRSALGLDPPPARIAIQRFHQRGEPSPRPEPTPRPLPAGPTTSHYPYRDAAGRVVLMVVRTDDPERRRKRFLQFRPSPMEGLWIAGGAPRPLPIYRLPEIQAADEKEPVVVVEGEKCVAAVLDAWPNVPVTTWAGGTNSWQHTNWAPLAERNVTLVADGDRTGRKAMRQLAAKLSALGCRVVIVLGALDDTDIADWLEADGREATAKKISALRTEWQASSVEIDADQRAAAPSGTGEAESLADNRWYRVLGLSEDRLAISIAAGRVLFRSREAMTNPATLIALAPQSWWTQLTQSEVLGTVQARAVGDSLIRAADEAGPVDLKLVAGRGAVLLDDGTVVYHLGDRLLVDGAERPLSSVRGRYWMAEPPIPLSDACGDGELRRIAEAVMRYRWLTPDDGRRMLGWIVSAIVGGALEWRPHVLLNAPSTFGKSWLLREVVARLMGPCLLRIADASPAAIARLTAQSSLPIAVDEAEPSQPWVLELLAQLRISSGAEGMRVRADVHGSGVIVQTPRYSALLSATAIPQLTQADATRLSVVRLGPPVDDWPAVRDGIVSAMAAADGARARIIGDAAKIVSYARALAREGQDAGDETREALGAAALTAGWCAWQAGFQWVSPGTGDAVELSDAGSALQAILALRHRRGSDERSILTMLQSSESAPAVTDLYGIRKDGGGLQIAPRHKGLVGALKRTPWADTDLRGLLLQLPGVSESANALRFASIRARAVVISEDILGQLGIVLDVDPADDPAVSVRLAPEEPPPHPRF